MSTISTISLAGITPPIPPTAAADPGASFLDSLWSGVEQVNASQGQAESLVEQLFTGGDVNPAEALVAVQKADMAFRLLMQLRNKLLAAYDEVKNIRI